MSNLELSLQIIKANPVLRPPPFLKREGEKGKEEQHSLKSISQKLQLKPRTTHITVELYSGPSYNLNATTLLSLWGATNSPYTCLKNSVVSGGYMGATPKPTGDTSSRSFCAFLSWLRPHCLYPQNRNIILWGHPLSPSEATQFSIHKGRTYSRRFRPLLYQLNRIISYFRLCTQYIIPNRFCQVKSYLIKFDVYLFCFFCAWMVFSHHDTIWQCFSESYSWRIGAPTFLEGIIANNLDSVAAAFGFFCKKDQRIFHHVCKLTHSTGNVK